MATSWINSYKFVLSSANESKSEQTPCVCNDHNPLDHIMYNNTDYIISSVVMQRSKCRPTSLQNSSSCLSICSVTKYNVDKELLLRLE